jgi:hypothetical protein
MRYLVIVLVLDALKTNAQVIISGKITDNKNKLVPGISITIKNSYDGATSDSAGNYSFSTDAKGDQILETTATGYKPFQQKINLTSNSQTINISLKELVTELNAVMITAGAFEASDQKKATVLNPIDIVTTASANGDVTGAIKTLPGTQQVGESEGLFVRGGSAAESKIFIDGTLINNFFYSSTPGIASRGRFNPFIFKGTIFTSGGYSALYGQALSSALILETIDLPERSSTSISLSFLFAGGGYQSLAKNKRSSWGINYNYTNLAIAFKLIKQKQEYFTTPVFHEGDANFRIKTSANGMLKYYGYFSTSKVGLRSEDVDSAGMKNAYGLENLNIYQNLSWKEKLGKGWRIHTGISFSTNRDNINSELQDANNIKKVITVPQFYAFKNFGLLTKSRFLNSKLVLEKKLAGLNALRFGTENTYSNEISEYTLYDGNKFGETVKENLLAGFGETDVYLTNDLAIKAGIRTENSKLLDKWNVAPRISLAYKFANNSQASVAYGIFYQNPERRYLPFLNTLDFAKATHYIAQYQKISKYYTFRTELFFKKYNDLFKTGTGNNGREVAVNNNGYGDAKGFELFWRDKKTIKNFDYWISYSFLDTKRNFLNFPKAIQPNFAANHTASLVMKKFVTKWKTQFNASYTFATGRPHYRIAYDYPSSKFVLTHRGKTKDYNSMSFSVNYLPNLGKQDPKSFAVWVFGINNILGSNNIYGYNYSNNGQNREAVTPPSKRFFFVVLFLSFGVDRTQEAINNNL